MHWRRRWRAWACRCTCRAWRAACWAATTRCRCATSAAMRCARPTACCWPACRATSDSTTAATCGAARHLIAANRSAKDARLNRRPNVAAIGDAGLFIESLAAALPAGARWSGWLDMLRARDHAREAEIDAQAAVRGECVNPLALFRALEQEAGDHAVFVADGGDFVATASYVLHPRAPLTWLDPGAFGTLGVGAGFAMGAALARPEREVWIVFGDGACGWGLSEFDSFVRHGIPVIALVGNDAGWTQIAREQVKMLHDDVATVLARSAYHEVVAGFGAEGLLVRRPDEVRPALARARELARQGRAVLVNVWLDKTEFREGSLSM